MGFFSWLCAKTNKSIPAYGHVDLPVILSTVVMVLPNDTKVEGVYDGYGNIDGVDVYEAIAPFLFGKRATRDDVFSNKKYITSPDGNKTTVEQFRYDEPLPEFKGMSLNELKEAGYTISTNFDKTEEAIKIVRQDAYNGEKYADLLVSKSCPDQGYFYSASKIRSLKKYATKLI